MTSQLSVVLHKSPQVACLLAGIVAAVVAVSRLSKNSNWYKLRAIPIVVPTDLGGSWWNKRRRPMHFMELVREGYVKYKSTPFRIGSGNWWMVILGSREHMDELRRAPEDVLSFHAAQGDTRYTLGKSFINHLHHFDLVLSQLTRSINILYHEIHSEVSIAFDETLDLKDNEWKSMPALDTIQKVVCRTTNRLFVGLPLCRDPEWINLNVQFTQDVQKASNIIKCFPKFLAPLVARFLTKAPEGRWRGMKLLTPVIAQRLEEYGKEWSEKPNDMLSWLLDLGHDGPERSVELLTSRIMSINFAAIHTSSGAFTNVLFFLAEYPEYIQPLREEVQSIVEKEGWSKASVGKMRKIDSFLRECQRLAGIAPLALFRKAMKDYTFSDGMVIPKGTFVAAPSQCVHLDEEYYHNAREFDPFRFSNMREEDGESIKHQLVATSLEYLPFGHGKHACPGRFFAASELKSMLAHIVVSYDLKLEDNESLPELRSGGGVAPDPATKVMFRKRIQAY